MTKGPAMTYEYHVCKKSYSRPIKSASRHETQFHMLCMRIIYKTNAILQDHVTKIHEGMLIQPFTCNFQVYGKVFGVCQPCKQPWAVSCGVLAAHL